MSAVSTFHTPTPFAPDSIQVVGLPSAGGGGTGGGSTGGGTQPSTGTAASASALVFSATCQASDVIGAVVRSNGSATAVTTVKATDQYPAIGIITAKSSDTACTVQTYGQCVGAVTGLTPNSRYFVGKDGKPAHASDALTAGGYLQIVGFAVAANALFVQPSGNLIQLAATRNADGADTTPVPSDAATSIQYGGILYGTDSPDPTLGRKGDSFLQYLSSGGVAIWGPKPSDDAWPAEGISLTDGRLYVRHGPPDGSVTPEPNDVWLDEDSDQIFTAQQMLNS